MKILLILSALVSLAISQAEVKTRPSDDGLIKIAVLDTGFDFHSSWDYHEGFSRPRLCKTGHRDFTGTGIIDRHGHGTHVAGIIGKYAKKDNYCLIILKFTDPVSKVSAMEASVAALTYAATLDISIINYSAGGESFDYVEYLAVRHLLNKGVKFVAAAGNNGHTLDFVVHQVSPQNLVFKNVKTGKISTKSPEHTYYPAMYDSRIVVVTNIDKNTGEFNARSNRGAIANYAEHGVNVVSLFPNNNLGTLTGTSQAAPVVSAKILNKQ